MKSRIVKEITPGERKIYDIFSDREYWVPNTERAYAKIFGYNHTYINKVRRSLILKGYLDEYGRPIKLLEKIEKGNNES